MAIGQSSPLDLSTRFKRKLLFDVVASKSSQDVGLLHCPDIGNSLSVDKGLSCPLLFSSRAMGIDSEGVSALIRSYLKGNDSFERHLAFANPVSPLFEETQADIGPTA
jgi:hypothetical protein